MDAEKLASPFTNEHLFVITELAAYGLAWITDAIPEAEKKFAEDVKTATPEKAEEMKQRLAHLKSLGGIAGKDAYAHFDHICKFLYESERKQSTKESENG